MKPIEKGPYDIVYRGILPPPICPIQHNELSSWHISAAEGASGIEHHIIAFANLLAVSKDGRNEILARVANARKYKGVSRFLYLDSEGKEHQATVLAAVKRADLNYPDQAFTLYLRSEPIDFDDFIAG
jgi:hypothetical protein